MSLRHMDPGVGISFALSFLVVGVAAVALHPPRESSPPTTASPDQPSPTATPAVPELTSRPAERQPVVPTTSRTSVGDVVRQRPATPIREASSIKPAPSRRPDRLRPREAFTDVAAGESLGDVARRVYGSADATEALWKANRDQVGSPDSPLRSGMLLRTP